MRMVSLLSLISLFAGVLPSFKIVVSISFLFSPVTKKYTVETWVNSLYVAVTLYFVIMFTSFETYKSVSLSTAVVPGNSDAI